MHGWQFFDKLLREPARGFAVCGVYSADDRALVPSRLVLGRDVDDVTHTQRKVVTRCARRRPVLHRAHLRADTRHTPGVNHVHAQGMAATMRNTRYGTRLWAATAHPGMSHVQGRVW